MIRPTRALLHPLWLVSLGVLVVNDHVLKELLHSPLTGKLSDFAGLIVAPPLFAALVGVRTWRGWLAAHAAIGTVFAALQLSADAAALWSALCASVGVSWVTVCDVTDLFALPMLVVSALVFRHSRPVPRWHRGPALLAGAVGLMASVATSPVRPPFMDTLMGQVFLHNSTPDNLEIVMRPLRADVVLDCEAVMADPATHLPEELFDVATVWAVSSGGTLPVDFRPEATCQAAWVEGDGFFPAVVAWWSDEFPEQNFNVWYKPDKESLPYGAVRVEGLKDGALWVADSELGIVFDPTPPQDVCPVAPEGDRLLWDFQDVGEAELLGVAEGADGCVAYDLLDDIGEQRRYLCGVDMALQPFGVGDRVNWSSRDDISSSLLTLSTTDHVLQLGRNVHGTVRLQGTVASCGAVIDPDCGSVALALDIEASAGGSAYEALALGAVEPLGEGVVQVISYETRIAIDTACVDGGGLGPAFDVAYLSTPAL